MKGNKVYMDLGAIFDDIFDAARSFSDEMHKNYRQYAPGAGHPFSSNQDENIDYYPAYAYPPMNVFMTSTRSLVFEFALAGFDEKDISLSFQGDYMVFSARIQADDPEDGVRYLKRRLKLKDIDRQKYFVPADKFAQEAVRAVFRNGILKISIPPKPEPATSEGIKIEIVKEGN